MTPTDGGGATRDDRLLAPTFWTAVVIVPVLVAAWTILYLFPGRTEELWAWTIRPRMTALVLGGGYLAGAFFFARVARTGRWHRVAPGFLGTTMFTTVLLAATVLHWDRFNHDHVSFWAWLALYLVTPPLLPLLWRNNRRTDPGTADADDVRIPGGLRRAVVVGGALQFLVATAMFVDPAGAASRWPWAVTPLTVRCIAAFVAFPAVIWMSFALDDRWSSFRIPTQTITLGLALVGLGALRVTDEFDGSTWSVRLFVVALVTSIVLCIVLQVAMDRRRAAGSPATTTTTT